MAKKADRPCIIPVSDEILTGIRVVHGGAPASYDTSLASTPPRTVMGAGFPLAAIVGSVDFMAYFNKPAKGSA